MFVRELWNDYPQRYRVIYDEDGYPAKLRRARAAAERLQDEAVAAIIKSGGCGG
jgi:hypothetical protein